MRGEECALEHVEIDSAILVELRNSRKTKIDHHLRRGKSENAPELQQTDGVSDCIAIASRRMPLRSTSMRLCAALPTIPPSASSGLGTSIRLDVVRSPWTMLSDEG